MNSLSQVEFPMLNSQCLRPGDRRNVRHHGKPSNSLMVDDIEKYQCSLQMDLVTREEDEFFMV